jgi:tetratricopeptide (TPR) repeat protein
VALAGTLTVTAVLLLLPKAEQGTRFVPRDDEVLAKVGPSPGRVDGGLSADEAASIALQLISQSRSRGGDPRLLGRAQAVLAPWWLEPAPPAKVRLMRATIKQSVHDFDGALVDLDELVRDEREVQAQLTRATVLAVQARYDDAERACLSMQGRVGDAVVAGCVAPVWAIRGKTAQSRDLLRQALSRLEARAPLRGWLEGITGEVLSWSGALEEAVLALRRALEADPTDAYSRLLLAALLTELARPGEAVALLVSNPNRNDAELLELVMAAKAAQDPRAAEFETELAGRVEASRRRGDSVHRREEARYALRLEGDGATALALAKQNFEVQREPADVRVLLEAALAMKDRAAAAPALAWMKSTGFADPRFTTLAAAVESLP